jgi:hypothetical protein
MNHIIEQQKERARAVMSSIEFLHGVPVDLPQEKLKDLDTLITQTHQATIAEVVRIVEEMRTEEERVQQWISKGGVDYIDNKARLDTINKFIEAITINKE